MDNKIKIGILGCANIAERSIIPTIINLNDKFKLHGIASRSLESATACAKKFACKAFKGYQSIINEDIDAVYIPLPNALHSEWINKSLEKGLHVLVEKSLACDLKDVISLNNLAKDKGLVLLENFQFRFHRQLEYILDMIRSNKLGELRCMRSSFGFPPFKDKNNIRYNKELGGGSLLDAGAYPLKLSQIIMGENIDIKASMLHYDDDFNVDTWGGAFLIQNEGELFSEIAFGFDNYYQCNVEIWGSLGKLSTERIFTAPSDYKPKISFETQKGKEIIELQPDNHFENMLNYFHNLIKGNNRKLTESEYKQNINQAKLINKMVKISHE